MLERFFGLKKHGTTVRVEFSAALTTFFSMAYILMVNAAMFSNPLGDGSNPLGVSYGAVYMATALTAVAGTLLIGLTSNLPLAQACGMGLNAFFVYTACIGFGLTYANALTLVLLDGLIFILLTVTGLRKRIFDAIPAQVRAAISAGICLFIAFMGMQNVGFVVSDAAATVMGSMCGISTVTTFVESAAGVVEGGRTGLTSVFTALMFLAAMLLSPLAQLVPACATAAVLVYIGLLMAASVSSIDWTDVRSAVPAFLTMVIMPFTFNISYGIAFGMIAYVVISALTDRAKELKPASLAVTLMFMAMLLLTH